jgi:phosphate transport system substrate-binding protein
MKISKILPCAALVLFSNGAFARDHIKITGSSTVYPFTTIIAEEFGNLTKFKTPIVESTGTGGRMKLFCSGIGENYPDFTNASRAIKASEVARCRKNGISKPTEIKIGYDGIVLANSKKSKKASLTKKQIFLALANKIPSNGKLIKNPHQKWSDVDKTLPNTKITVYGPPPTSGTRDAFVELVMEKACVKLPEFVKAYPNKKSRKKACHIMRIDGRFIEAGENDNLIVQKLKNDSNALGIFGFSFLQQNSGSVQGAKINNVQPTFDNIIDGKYGVSRPLFIYLKKEHIGKVPGVKEFAKEIVSEDTIGEEGYLVDRGLIPMTESEFQKIRARVLK